MTQGTLLESSVAETFGQEHRLRESVVFVVNTDWFFLSHRAAWALALRASGARVAVIARDSGRAEEIRAMGIEFVDLDLGRESSQAGRLPLVSFRLSRAISRMNATTVFLVSTAAYTLALPAVLTNRGIRFVNVITGAGRALAGGGSKATVVKACLRILARRPNVRTLFQTDHDRGQFLGSRMADAERSEVITGTGIDVSKWKPGSSTAGATTVLFAARLIAEKGPKDFVEVARRLKSPSTRFLLAGPRDLGVSSSVTTKEIESWHDQEIVHYIGNCRDMRELYAQADILVAPSVHPEGTPRALIEASSCGLAIVAYDQPGVRAVLDDGRSGIIVPSGDIEALTVAVSGLLSSPESRRDMATSAIRHAHDSFGIEGVLERLYQFVFVR